MLNRTSMPSSMLKGREVETIVANPQPSITKHHTIIRSKSKHLPRLRDLRSLRLTRFIRTSSRSSSNRRSRSTANPASINTSRGIPIMMNNTIITSNTVRNSRTSTTLARRSRHQIPFEVSSLGWNILQLWLPVLEIILCIVQDLAGLTGMLVGWTDITRDDGSVVEEVEETATVAGEDDLLLCALDGSCELGSICLLHLLSGNVGQLSLSNQILRLSTNKLLLQRNQLGALRLLNFQLRNLIRNLRFVVTTWLHALLRVPNRLQDRPAIIEVMRIQVLLLAQVGELSCDGESLLAGCFVALDQVVLGFDQLVELLAEFGLHGAAEGAEAEAMAGVGCGGGTVLVRTNGECSIHFVFVLEMRSTITFLQIAG